MASLSISDFFTLLVSEVTGKRDLFRYFALLRSSLVQFLNSLDGKRWETITVICQCSQVITDKPGHV